MSNEGYRKKIARVNERVNELEAAVSALRKKIKVEESKTSGFGKVSVKVELYQYGSMARVYAHLTCFEGTAVPGAINAAGSLQFFKGCQSPTLEGHTESIYQLAKGIAKELERLEYVN